MATEKKNSAGAARLKCTGTNCNSEFQNKRYGRDIRVHNGTVKNTWRCTVCKTERSGSKW